MKATVTLRGRNGAGVERFSGRVRMNPCMDTHAWTLLDDDAKAHILRSVERQRAAGPPFVVDLEWSRRRFLPDATGRPRPPWPSDEMDRYTLERLFEEMEATGVKGLVLGGEGDPLGHRSLTSLIQRLVRASFAVWSLSADAETLTAQTSERLLPLVRARIEVRFDAIQNRNGRGGLVPAGRIGQRIASALEPLRSPDGSARTRRVVARLVLTPENCLSIKALAEAALAMGADGVVFAASRRPGDADAFLQQRTALLNAAGAAIAADAEKRIEPFEAPHPSLGDDWRALWPQGMAPVKPSFRSACLWPWLGLAVAPNGAVFPCRRALEGGEAVIGNVHAHSLKSLWRSRLLRGLRRQVSSEGEPTVCRVCRREGGPPLPYARDRGFGQELDRLLRGGRERAIRFPERLCDREWGTVVLPLRCLMLPWGEGLQVRVDGVPVGMIERDGGGVAIRFRSDDLQLGFHLLEVVDGSGRLLQARLVKKIG